MTDLARVGLGQRAAEHGEVLGEDADRAAIDRSEAGNDAVAGDLLLVHAEVAGAMLHEDAELLQRAGIQKEGDALAGRQSALLVQLLDAGRTATGEGLFTALFELGLTGLGAQTASLTVKSIDP